MVDKINDGGSAFPIEARYGAGFCLQEGASGMTLRDWFAGRIAPPETMSNSTAEMLAGRPMPTWSPRNEIERIRFWAEAKAMYRYIHADAMLAARERGR